MAELMATIEAPSLPTRGAWIETLYLYLYLYLYLVAPHTGSVD